jgi:Lipocalin-like domain
MKWSTLAVIAAAAIWAGISPAVSAENALVGTWQLTGFSLVVADTRETSRPYGDHPTGLIQFSPGGHMVMFLAAGELKAPASGSYTDAERADIHRSIVGAYAATYTVEGNTVVYHVLTSWRPEWIGRDQVRYFEINGTKLTIKTTPVTFTRTGQTIVATLTFDRAE